jgi:protein-tyrosine phosphatase
MHSLKTVNYLAALRRQPVISVHIVCLGNICRSPIANAVLLGLTKDLTSPKVLADSSGTGSWHVGQPAANNSELAWQSAGYKYQHIAKQFNLENFIKHDLILAMDLSNRDAILKLAKSDSDKDKVFMFTSFDPNKSKIDPDGDEANKLSVADPYGGSLTEFESVLKVIEAAATGFVTWVSS